MSGRNAKLCRKVRAHVHETRKQRNPGGKPHPLEDVREVKRMWRTLTAWQKARVRTHYRDWQGVGAPL